MAEVAHTCINSSPFTGTVAPCPGCQDLHTKIFQKEREVLVAVEAWVKNSDQPSTVANALDRLMTLTNLGKELAELQAKRAPFG
jgi:hypothetical protein